ncbi:cold shock domain-containing protein [Micromonospora humi]|uniref:cold shock domain-containing protein n=1 Tax=Micromonospora humi TaxID=745366 RepID=UPI000B880FBC|nr:cold shock domain-containing protein [Micromonospora humi]
MTSVGSVGIFDAEEGLGVIDGPDVPGGCWVHFSAIATDGYREFTLGQHFSFRVEVASQDGFAYRAMKVWTGDVEPADQPRTQRSSRCRPQLADLYIRSAPPARRGWTTDVGGVTPRTARQMLQCVSWS